MLFSGPQILCLWDPLPLMAIKSSSAGQLSPSAAEEKEQNLTSANRSLAQLIYHKRGSSQKGHLRATCSFSPHKNNGRQQLFMEVSGASHSLSASAEGKTLSYEEQHGNITINLKTHSSNVVFPWDFNEFNDTVWEVWSTCVILLFRTKRKKVWHRVWNFLKDPF